MADLLPGSEKQDAPMQLRRAESQLLQKKDDGTRIILLTYGGRVSRVTIRPTKDATFARHRPFFARAAPIAPKKSTGKEENASGKNAEAAEIRAAGGQAAAASKRVGVNKEFFRQLRAIFMIIVPRSTSKEVFIFILHTVFLVLRTYLSVVVARLDGAIVRDLVAARGSRFMTGILYWFIIAVPATYTNSMIRFLQSKLSIAFRTRLTRYVHDLYLNDQGNYYKLINLDSRIDGADQFITTDIGRFCETLSSLYSNLAKPALDMIIFNYQLSRSIGNAGMFGLFINYVTTAWVLRKLTPAFGKLAAIEAKLEGDFRAAHSRLITNAEEVAFYNGAELERTILNRSYQSLIRHTNSIYKIRVVYNMIEDYIVKYSWSAIGYGLSAIPTFFPEWAGMVKGVNGKSRDRTGSFITNRRLMLSLADAGGRMMFSYKDLAELAGYTSRVYTLISTLHAMNNDEFQCVDRPAELANDEPFYDLGNINGKVESGGDVVEFKNVPIVTPAPGLERGGELLVKNLNVCVKKGDHLLVTGPNGVGKSSIARILSGLWPVFEGVVIRPARKDIFFIPQRAYLSMASLRDQIIYPHAEEDMRKAQWTDEHLQSLLEAVHLAYIPGREGGFDTKKDWGSVFSGGERQRVQLARMFYHQPKFAVLDEATSAVSSDVEGLLYQGAKDRGITLITISHRPSLYRYHSFLLKLTGEDGEWQFSTIGTQEGKLSMANEIAALEKKLEELDGLKARVEEINAELSMKSH